MSGKSHVIKYRCATIIISLSTEGKSDDWSDKVHFPLHGPRSISAFIYFIDETAHGLCGLHLESASESRYSLGTGATRTD